MNGTSAMQLVWQPVIPSAFITLMAAALAALAVFAYARSARARPGFALGLMAMRLITIAALAALLMGPSILPPRTQLPGRPPLTILLDTSGSMLTQDAAGQSRLAYILDHWLPPQQLRQLSDRFDLRLVGFAESMRSLTPAALAHSGGTGETGDSAGSGDSGGVGHLATGRATHYANALTAALLNLPPPDSLDAPDASDAPNAPNASDASDASNAMLLVIGDGHDTDRKPLAPAAALAAERQVPIHTLAVGSDTSPPDLAVVALPRQEYLLVGEPGQVAVRLQQAGLEDATATVHLRGGGAEQTRRISFDGKPTISLELPIRESQPGLYQYTVSVDPIEGEAVTTNNSHTVFVEVTEERIRVLVLEGEPYWDTKFLARSLRADPRIELARITQVSPARREGITTRSADAPPAVPTTLEDFAAYDVVILGRGLADLMTPQTAQLLDRYVAEAGGQVIFARGRAYNPDTAEGRAIGASLAPIEPVIWDRDPGQGRMHDVPLSLTPAGRGSPAFSFVAAGAAAGNPLGHLPGLAVMPVVDRVKPATVVLAEGDRPAPIDAESGAGAGPGAQPRASRPPAVVMMTYGRGRVFAILGEGLWQWSFLPPDLHEYQGIFDAFWSNTVRWLAMGGGFQPGQQISLTLGRSTLRLGDPLLIDIATRFAPPPGFHPSVTLTDPDGNAQPVSVSNLPGMDTRFRATVAPDQPGVWRVTLDASGSGLTPARQEPRRFSVYDPSTERLRTAARPDLLRTLAEQTGGLFLDARHPLHLADQLTRHQAAKLVPPHPRYTWARGPILAVLLIWLGLEWIGRRRGGWL